MSNIFQWAKVKANLTSLNCLCDFASALLYQSIIVQYPSILNGGYFYYSIFIMFLIDFECSNFAVSRQTETFQNSLHQTTCLTKVIHFHILVIRCQLKKILALSTKKRNTKLSIASLRGIECYKIYT